MEELIQPGTRVIYWGNAAGGKYYGTEFTVDWANECGCKHQTYSITNSEGKNLSQALATSIRVVE
jgi:hypothetical protein